MLFSHSVEYSNMTIKARGDARLDALVSQYGRPTPRYLYRYTPIQDKYGSLRRALVDNQWYFNSRVKFDDQKDMIIPEVKLAGFGDGRIEARRKIQRL
jgi:hypothetical protein